MSSSRGKKTVVPASKKRKETSSSAGPTAKIRHLFYSFPKGPQEELFQILRARPLIEGRCIDWATVEQVQMDDTIRALLTTNPWEPFFRIIEPTYLELMMELCSTFHLQTLTRLQGSERVLALSTPKTSTLMVHVARARHQPFLFHRPCDSAPDGAASERGHLHWPLRDLTGATLWAPQHRCLRIIPHPRRPDVSTRHLEHA
ncbi:hypothetical protein GOBAR_AA38857 [Gossypium barbadense]|uniref:Uncharacterized protein n=1 Tax=Gossypium barbadense TaxID=3634 RepID=A0A2P5VSP7_GOSBA|nr:hypothetical protein GOBAR_AA38857 [Gossypium barbadense]